MRARHPRERGQVLVVFVFALVAIFAMGTLVFDGGNALVRKRQFQDAGDAAALAAANVIQSGTKHGCSLTAGPPPGAARPEVVSAAQAAVLAALPGFDTSKIVVTCPDGWDNNAVQVDISGRSPLYFGGALGLNGFAVGTTSQAVNGQIGAFKYSVLLLDPWNQAWSNGYQGCPSGLLSGGPTVTFDGSMQIDSACPAVYGGAFGTNGNAAVVTFNNGAHIGMVGGYAPGPLLVSPGPLVGQPYVKDPLAGLPAVPVSSLPVQSNSKLTLSGAAPQVLLPGVYKGGIQMKNQAVALLRPGLYVMQGGGFAAGAGNKIYSVAAGVSTTSDSMWATDCPVTTCGVLVFNTGTTSSMGQLSIGAGATLRLRSYLPSADPNAGALTDASAYQNLLFWQDVDPVPTSGYQQPVVQLNGGGTVDIAGTVYAPSAAVQMGGGSGGGGATTTDLTLQFICWDLTLQGNSSFHFYYNSTAFAKPTDYGLIK